MNILFWGCNHGAGNNFTSGRKQTPRIKALASQQERARWLLLSLSLVAGAAEGGKPPETLAARETARSSNRETFGCKESGPGRISYRVLLTRLHFLYYYY